MSSSVLSFENAAGLELAVSSDGRDRLRLSEVEDANEASVDSAVSEAQLICRIGQGDGEALGALYDHYAKPLYSFAVRILNDHGEAEDTLQEVFIVIWQKAHSFDEVLSKPFSWAMRITRNKAIDRLRVRQRRWRMFGVNADNLILAEMKDKIQPVENFCQDQLSLMRAAINELPDEQRRPIELAFFSGLVHFEIAAELGEPLGTIKARIRRGMLRLRDNLEGRI